MPHDTAGNRLEVGDRVSIACRVKQIFTTEEYCNLTLETIELMYPGNERTMLTLNAKQVTKQGA